MSGCSSSGSWRGGRGGRGGDIIDLDQYMRQARPPRQCDSRWIVAASSEDERDAPSSDSEAVTQLLRSVPQLPLSAPRPQPVPRSRATRPFLDKRQSHDSGLSDGSYRQPRRKNHTRRRLPSATVSRTMAHKLPPGPGWGGCPGPGPGPKEVGQLRAEGDQISRARCATDQPLLDTDERKTSQYKMFSKPMSGSDDTSDLSSSSCSGPTGSRRPDEITTYKIIMTKLDELKTMFNARSPPPPLPPRPARVRRPPPAASVSSSSSSLSAAPQMSRVSRASLRHTTSTVRSGVGGRSVQRDATHTLSRDMQLRTRRDTSDVRLDSALLRESSVETRARGSYSTRLHRHVDDKCSRRDETLHKQSSNRSSTLTRIAPPGPAAGAGGAAGAAGGSSNRCQSLCGRCRVLWRAITGRTESPSPHHA